MSDPTIRLSGVTLVVADTSASAAFYRLLGLGVPDEGPQPHIEIPNPDGPTEIDLDDAELAKSWGAAYRQPGGGPSAIVSLAVGTRDGVDELYERAVAAGHPGIQPPFDAFWGARYAIVADPDGNHVGLMSPMTDEHAYWPPTTSPDP
jgi:predicted enzyme related to lactoylglutathione lyase